MTTTIEQILGTGKAKPQQGTSPYKVAAPTGGSVEDAPKPPTAAAPVTGAAQTQQPSALPQQGTSPYKVAAPTDNVGSGNNGAARTQTVPASLPQGTDVSKVLAGKDDGVTKPNGETVELPGWMSDPSRRKLVADTGLKMDKDGHYSYAQLNELLNPYKAPTAEELEKERKKQKREKIFAAIGDGISALSNLYFTSQYAPNMYDPKAKTQSQQVQDRWDKLKAERDANKKAYYDGLIKAQALDDEYAQKEREWEQKKQAAKDKADKAKADRERADQLAQAKIDLLAAQKAGKEADVAYLQAKTSALEAGLPLDEALKKARIAQALANANKANRQGTSSWVGGKGGRSGGGKYYGTFDGVAYQTKADYDKAVEAGAKEAGVPTTESNGFGRKKNRAVSKVAQETEAKKRQATRYSKTQELMNKIKGKK